MRFTYFKLFISIIIKQSVDRRLQERGIGRSRVAEGAVKVLIKLLGEDRGAKTVQEQYRMSILTMR